MNDKLKSVCFTGHRKIPPFELGKIKAKLIRVLTELIEEEETYFYAGGALGFDTMAALTVLELKKIYPQIKLILILPCKNQTKDWNERDIEIYNEIKDKCDEYFYTANEYYSGCMQKRNKALVDNSSVCICYCTKASGGTAYTLGYAEQNNLKIINLSRI